MNPQHSSSSKDKSWSRHRLWILFLLLCAIGIAAAIRRTVALASMPVDGPSPFANLDEHFAGKAGMTLLHIVPSLLFLLLLPLQFVSTIRRRFPRFHRWIGRTLMMVGALVGVSALWLSADPTGGAVEATATILFGCLFLFFLVRAWWHIRNRRVELHREWAIRMAGLALGVATTLPIIAVFFATSRLTGLTPRQFFGPAMWIGFTVTYLAAEIWITKTRLRRGVPTRERELPAEVS